MSANHELTLRAMFQAAAKIYLNIYTMTIPSSEIHTRSLTCLKLPVVRAVITWVRPWENTMLSQTDTSVVSAAVHIVTHVWWEET